ncbi:DUF397 domain-containing protein [Plantactinospora sp. B5E13]|uniref:DUF397 domain-containing protein n=1 Tax=Plantactinospora sp. B5E13 TaxID=3153758 RepID=UPI00325C5F2A
MAEPTTTGVRWRKSSRSGDNGGNCVEVADSLPTPPGQAEIPGGVGVRASVGVRDSKDPTGPILRFSPTAWTTFLHHTPGRR